MICCPECGCFCSNDEDLAKHLNEHEIAAAAQNNSAPSNSTACFCPICDTFLNSQKNLEEHLRNFHSLSVSGATSEFQVDFDPEWAECPVCGSEIDRKLIEDHVKQHFDVDDSGTDENFPQNYVGNSESQNFLQNHVGTSGTRSFSRDEQLARQLQAAESSSFAEELQFQQLKESYGMDDQHGGYCRN